MANALGVPSFYQVKINSTNSGVRLPNIPATNGVSVTAHPLNSQPASVGGTIGTSGVNNITNGSGNGSILIPGTQKGYPVTNSNLLYVNGVAGDIFFVEVY